MKKMYKTQKGITLVALVITIILLIILAAVSINAVMNDGLIENSKDAAKTANTENLKEQAKIAYLDWQVKSELGQTTDAMQKYVKTQLKEQGFTQEEINGITISDTGEVKEIEIAKIETLPSNSTEVTEFVAAMDDSLIYNAGYLTGLVDTANKAMYTKTTLLAKLPQGANILDTNGNSIADTQVIGTGYRIVNSQGKVIAYTIFFGDGSGEGSSTVRENAMIKNILRGSYGDEMSYKLSHVWADINGDGKVSLLDADRIMDGLRAGWALPYYGWEDEEANIDQFRPATPNIEIEY